MKRAIRQILLLAVLVAVLPATAVANTPDAAARDCIQDGSVDGSYSDSVLNRAIDVIRSRGDSSVYGDCEAVLASLIGSGGGPRAKASGSDAADADSDGKVTPTEKRAEERREAVRKRRQLASLDDVAGGPAGDPLQIDDSSDDGMPLPLMLLLIVLVLLAAGGGLWYAAQRNPGVANALRRVPLPGRRS